MIQSGLLVKVRLGRVPVEGERDRCEAGFCPTPDDSLNDLESLLPRDSKFFVACLECLRSGTVVDWFAVVQQVVLCLVCWMNISNSFSHGWSEEDLEEPEKRPPVKELVLDLRLSAEL
jgi:hypothetical protein